MTARQIRGKPPSKLQRQRDVIVACSHFRSSVNLSRVLRLLGCAGIPKLVTCGNVKPDPRISREAEQHVTIEPRRTLTPWLEKTRADGYAVIALEQTDRSQCLYEFRFPRSCVLLIGNERTGIPDNELALADAVVEIPVYGAPASYNVFTATTMMVYEYCRQYPEG